MVKYWLQFLKMTEFIKKIEYYCLYQERCHNEVIQKLYQIKCPKEFQDEVIAHLITNNYLNEERFAILFTQSKFNQKQWGKVRIENELKQKNISSRNIQKALSKINNEEYLQVFQENTILSWDAILEKNKIKKIKKFTDYWLRKGFEKELVYQKAKELLKTI